VAPKTHLLKKRNPRKTTTSIQHNSDNKWHQTHLKTEKLQKAGKMLGRKQKTDKISLDFQTYCQCHHGRAWKRIRKIKRPSFYCQYRGSRKVGFEPRNPRDMISDVATSKKSKITTTHIIWWTQCQCNTISSSSVVMTKSNQIKKIKWTLSNLRYRAAATNNWWCFEQYQPSFLQNSW